jgi:hypothetical protein
MPLEDVSQERKFSFNPNFQPTEQVPIVKETKPAHVVEEHKEPTRASLAEM